MKAKLFIPVVAGMLLFAGCSNKEEASSPKKASEQSEVKTELTAVSLKNFGNKRLEVTTKAKGTDVKYAYYIHKDNKLFKKISYSKDSSLKYPLKESGRYKVRVFAKGSDDKKVVKSTNAVNVVVDDKEKKDK
ncbi:triple tyrosine motif-containing protein [Priestia aryabhattai]|uniref:triple tyrosine motif-containing protein n=1 Tax=Priestia aryabhattai TaxID=412384 RepID=UPI001C24FB47|nr:triple tyrosine motif-containing protein [Priestia aryabhattai]MBU8853984.1 hypothetical protein [Bacillus sp. FJAT-26377]